MSKAPKEAVTAWTTYGQRLSVTERAEGDKSSITLRVEAMVVGVDAESGDRARKIWHLSQLAVASLVNVAEVERLVAHWLGFYLDAELVALGVAAVRERFASMPWAGTASTEIPKDQLQ